MDTRIYMQMLIFLMCTCYITISVVAQRKSESKCSYYSEIPTVSWIPFPHLAVWVKQDRTIQTECLAESLRVQYVTLISEKYLLGAGGHTNEEKGQIYFSINDSHNVTQIIKNPYKSGDRKSPINDLVLLKIRRIQLDSNHRPSCLWTMNGHTLNSVQVALPFLPIRCTFHCPVYDDVLKRTFNIKLISFNTSINGCYAGSFNDASYNSKLCIVSDSYGPSSFEYDFVQFYNPLRYLPNNFYVYGMTKQDPNITEEYFMSDRFTPNIIDWIESQVWDKFWIDTHKSCGTIRILSEPIPHLLFPRETIAGQFPWHAAIYLSTPSGTDYICGGSLITNNTILTAAHCLHSSTSTVSASSLIVILGKYHYNLTSPESRESGVVDVTVHKDFNYNSFENDIALLKLEKEIDLSEYIQTICLTSNTLLFEEPIYVLPGWGLNELNQAPSVLKQGSFLLRPNKDCRGDWQNISRIADKVNDNNLCAGYKNGTVLCMGDSGGGLVYTLNNQWYIRGIASVGSNFVKLASKFCEPLELNLFTDVLKFYPWIIDNMDN